MPDIPPDEEVIEEPEQSQTPERDQPEFEQLEPDLDKSLQQPDISYPSQESQFMR